jgi:nucleotide-binding universal stress UspA family protein
MKILVAYTGKTELDSAVLVLAKKNAKLLNAVLYIASSMESATENEINDLTRIESKLESLKDSITKEGIPCKTHLLIRGLEPGEDIVEFAQDEKIDQIYIGIEKKSKVGKLIFGSNAQHIILEAPCPVISVNKEALPNLKSL